MMLESPVVLGVSQGQFLQQQPLFEETVITIHDVLTVDDLYDKLSVLDLLKFCCDKTTRKGVQRYWKIVFQESISDTQKKVKEISLLQFCVCENFFSSRELHEVLKVLEMSIEDRRSHLCEFSEYDLNVLQVGSSYIFTAPSIIVALMSKLITLDQAIAMPVISIDVLCSEWGLVALREKLITPDQARVMPDYGYVDALCSEWGLVALREKLITPDQARAMPDYGYVKALCSEWGLVALREKLITPDQAIAMSDSGYVKALCSEWGLVALRGGLITLDQAIAMSVEYVHVLCSEEGVEALRERPITLEQARAMPKAGYAHAL